MDNYNGQNQYESGQNYSVQDQNVQNQYAQNPNVQNLYMQNQNQQNQHNYNPQNMYSAPEYQNGYPNPTNYAKPKNKALKWLLIIGIPSVVLITAAILIIVLVGSSYDIDDYNDLSKVCGEVLNTKLVEQEDYYGSALSDGIVATAKGSGGFSLDDKQSRIRVKVTWVKFINEKTAELYYKEEVNDYREEYVEEMQQTCIGEWDSDDEKTEAYLGDAEKIEKIILIREDEYILFVAIDGKTNDVKRLSEEFIDEID